jgi:hypothetical protein
MGYILICVCSLIKNISEVVTVSFDNRHCLSHGWFFFSGVVLDSQSDHNAAETGFGAAGIGGHGKYFQ